MWKYEQLDTREDVITAMPDNWTVRVYKVTSGDSGKKYHVQIVEEIRAVKLLPGAPGSDRKERIYLCNCPEGTFKAPLSIVGALPYGPCKHAQNLAMFLAEKKR